MAEKDTIPANGAVLRWAREQAGLNRREAALFLGIPEMVLTRIEGGGADVSPVAFERMQSVYRTSESVLLLPDVPIAEPQVTNFRTVGSKAAKPSPGTTMAIREALRFQQFISDILEEDPELIRHAEITHRTLGDDPEAVAAMERRRWGVPVGKQMAWTAGQQSVLHWRARATELGFIVLLKQMPWEDCRGLALPDADLVPTLVVNTEDAPAAQVFTIFHEIGHLLLGEAGACVQRGGNSYRGRIERWCNRFAAAFLVPERELRSTITERFGSLAPQSFTMSHIDRIATLFRVSKHVIARRLADLEMSDFYAKYADELFEMDRRVRLPQKGDRTVRRPAAHVMRLREIGATTAHAILEAVRADVVEVTEAADVLDLPVDQLLELETRAEVQRRKDLSA